jgi:hypothetical protein
MSNQQKNFIVIYRDFYIQPIRTPLTMRHFKGESLKSIIDDYHLNSDGQIEVVAGFEIDNLVMRHSGKPGEEEGLSSSDYKNRLLARLCIPDDYQELDYMEPVTAECKFWHPDQKCFMSWVGDIPRTTRNDGYICVIKPRL